MQVNAKMIAIQTVPGIRGGKMKERSAGVNSSMMYFIYCKNLCKYSAVRGYSCIQHNNNLKKAIEILTTILLLGFYFTNRHMCENTYAERYSLQYCL
jgi:hypothetical protein